MSSEKTISIQTNFGKMSLENLFWKNGHYKGQNTPIHPKPNILDYPRN
jgi:hypothetical protein